MDMKNNLYTQIVRDLSETQEGREELFLFIQGIILEKDAQKGDELRETLKKLCYLDAAVRSSFTDKRNAEANSVFVILHKKLADAVNTCGEVKMQKKEREESYG